RVTLTPSVVFFFFHDTATTHTYTLSLHDALPIYLRQSASGRRLLAVRANERAAAAAGVDVVGTKLLASGLASFLAGVAGVLIGYQLVQFSAEGFDATAGLALLALAYLGGIASVAGAL